MHNHFILLYQISRYQTFLLIVWCTCVDCAKIYIVPLHPCLIIILFLWKEIWDTLRWEFKQDFKNIRKENTLSPKKKVRFKKKKERKHAVHQEKKKEKKNLTKKTGKKTRSWLWKKEWKHELDQEKKESFYLKQFPPLPVCNDRIKLSRIFFTGLFLYVMLLWCMYFDVGILFVYVDMCLCTWICVCVRRYVFVCLCLKVCGACVF